MLNSSRIVAAEKISEKDYKLITEEGFAYYYEYMDPKSDDEAWKNYILEGQQILLGWIENQGTESPACIYWNYLKMAMLEVKVKTPYCGSSTTASEINPFDLKDMEEWVIDPNCPS